MSALQMTGKAIAESERSLSKSVTSTSSGENALNRDPPNCAQSLNLGAELRVPDKPAPSTLPNRNVSKFPDDHHDIDANPLHILRDKNYRIVRPRIKVHPDATNLDTAPTQCIPDEACESPSYLTHTQYTFSERDINIHNNNTHKFIGSKEIENLNPIPLPPRDRNKVLLTNVKRHVRKHPLIVPASSLQRTLNKVTSPMEEKESGAAFANVLHHDEIDGSGKSTSSSKINYNTPRTSTKPAEVNKMKQYTSSW